MNKFYTKMLAVICAVFLMSSTKAQVTIFSENWATSSFTTNAWTFPNGQPNWQIGANYTPLGGAAPNAYFFYSPTITNYSIALLSNTINATSYTLAPITLDYLLQLNNYSSATLEQFKVEYKTLAGTTWSLLAAYTNTAAGISNWAVSNATLTGMEGQLFQIKFTAFGANSFNINGWGLDNITVKAACIPALAISLTPTTLCTAGQKTLTASGSDNYTWTPGASTNTSIVVNPTMTTTYSVASTNTALGCVETRTLLIGVTPTLTITGPTAICASNPATLTASGSTSYTWNTGSTSSSITVSPAVTTVYTVSSNSGGCVGVKTHTISISPISASITGGALCAPGSKTLTASGSDNYTWTPGASTNTTIVVTPSVTTIYTVASTNTLANCVQTFTLAVGVTPSINITGPSTICASTPATLTASGSTTYTWNTGSTSSSITVSPAGTTVYTVSSNSGGCVGVATKTINTNPLPVISVSPVSSTICVPGSPSVALTASGGSTYTWMPGAGLSNTVGTSVNALPSSSTIYTVTGTSSLNCNSTATAAIMVNIGVSITTISANPASICAGNNATLTASATSSVNYCQPAYSIGSGSGDYLSNVMLSTLSNSTGPSPSPYYVLYPQGGTTTTTLTAGSTYSLYIQAGTYGTNAVSAWIDYNQNGNLANTGEKLGEVTGLGASPATATLVFTVPANAGNGSTRLRVREIFNGINHDPCAQATYGETEDYIITIVGGVSALSYTWAPSTFLSSTNTNSTVATAATVTTVYTVTVSNSIGCSNFASTTVSVNSAPTLSVSGSSTICAGQAANISASGATTYTWNTGATTSSIAPTPTANATYTVIGANGACTSNASFTVNVGALPSVSLTAAQATACVNGSTISLTGSPAGGVYTGSNVAGSVFTPGAVAGTFTPSYSFTSTVNGCSKTANVNIVVNPCTGIDSKAIASSELSVYPNPNTGIFTLELNNGAAKTVVVTDLTGRVILTETSTANKLNINISNFANGVYFVKVQSNSTVEVIRVVKH